MTVFEMSRERIAHILAAEPRPLPVAACAVLQRIADEDTDGPGMRSIFVRDCEEAGLSSESMVSLPAQLLMILVDALGKAHDDLSRFRSPGVAPGAADGSSVRVKWGDDEFQYPDPARQATR